MSNHPAVEFFAAFGLLTLVGATPLEALLSVLAAGAIRAGIRMAQESR